MVCLRLDISRRRLASRVSSGERHCAGRFVQARDINSDFAPHFLTVTLVQDFAMLYSLNTEAIYRDYPTRAPKAHQNPVI